MAQESQANFASGTVWTGAKSVFLGEIAEYSKDRVSHDQVHKSNYVGVDNLLQDMGGRVDSRHLPSSGKLTEYRSNDVLIGNIRPYLRKIWLSDRIGGTNGDVLVIRITKEILDPRYLYRVLATESFFSYSMKHSKGTKMPRGSKPMILRYPVRIPCPNNLEKSLSIQAEIVRVLEKLSDLTNQILSELDAEKSTRRKQYAYYRDLILNGGPVND